MVQGVVKQSKSKRVPNTVYFQKEDNNLIRNITQGVYQYFNAIGSNLTNCEGYNSYMKANLDLKIVVKNDENVTFERNEFGEMVINIKRFAIPVAAAMINEEVADEVQQTAAHFSQLKFE
jgi:protein associated with RNAse G/E